MKIKNPKFEGAVNYDLCHLPPDHPWNKNPPKVMNDREARAALFSSLPSGGVVAEIGVECATTTDLILEHASPEKIYLIDPWELCEKSTEKWNFDTSSRKLIEDKYKDKHQVEIIQDFSIEASKKFDNHYFDWIHIDIGVETYAGHAQTLAHWLPKIKKGGYLTGDIFCLFGVHNSNVYGPVVEFILRYVEKDPEIWSKCIQHQETILADIINGGGHRRVISTLGPSIMTSEKYAVLGNMDQPGLFSDLSFIFGFLVDLKFKIGPIVSPIILKHIDYFPSTRAEGGSYCLKIGDWVDDLDYDEIIQASLGFKQEKNAFCLSKGKINFLIVD